MVLKGKWLWLKRVRPGITYEQFVKTWEQLAKEGRAGTNAVLEVLGGNKSTIAAFREQYEREKYTRELALIESIELPKGILKALADVKINEIEKQQAEILKLRECIDDLIGDVKQAEERAAVAEAEAAVAKQNFDAEKLSLAQNLSAVQARMEDIKDRERILLARIDELSESCNAAKQEAAVAKKEGELLREQNEIIKNKSTKWLWAGEPNEHQDQKSYQQRICTFCNWQDTKRRTVLYFCADRNDWIIKTDRGESFNCFSFDEALQEFATHGIRRVEMEFDGFELGITATNTQSVLEACAKFIEDNGTSMRPSDLANAIRHLKISSWWAIYLLRKDKSLLG